LNFSEVQVTIGKDGNGGEKQLENGEGFFGGTSESKQVFKFVTRTTPIRADFWKVYTI
jgi:hypothetical protein